MNVKEFDNFLAISLSFFSFQISCKIKVTFPSKTNFLLVICWQTVESYFNSLNYWFALVTLLVSYKINVQLYFFPELWKSYFWIGNEKFVPAHRYSCVCTRWLIVLAAVPAVLTLINCPLKYNSFLWPSRCVILVVNVVINHISARASETECTWRRCLQCRLLRVLCCWGLWNIE